MGDVVLVFDREFPITILTRDVTNFVSVSVVRGNELSWQIGRFVQVLGCFYRLWSFDSELMRRQGNEARQAAPLVVASAMKPALPAVTPSRTRDIGWFGYGLCLATLGILAVILIQTFRKDNRRIRLRSR